MSAERSAYGKRGPSLAIFSRTYGEGALSDLFIAAARDGYSGVHFNFGALGLPTLPESITTLTCERVARCAMAAGLRIVGVSATYNMIHPDPEQRELLTRRAERIIELAPALQTQLVTLCTGTRDPDDMWRAHQDNSTTSAWQDLVATLRTLRATAQRSGVMLGIEPESGNVVCTAERARALIETLGPESLGIILDPANILAGEEPERRATVIRQAIETLSRWIVVFHAKEHGTLTGQPRSSWSELELSLSLLAEQSFKGPVVVHDVPRQRAAAARDRLAGLIERHFPEGLA
jgi:sugar phosphate isomerase/epimerase